MLDGDDENRCVYADNLERSHELTRKRFEVMDKLQGRSGQ